MHSLSSQLDKGDNETSTNDNEEIDLQKKEGLGQLTYVFIKISDLITKVSKLYLITSIS